MLAPVDEFRQDKTGRQDGDNAHRHVHIEDPAPAPVIGNPSTQRWPNNRGKTKNGHEQALPFTAFRRRKDIADDCQCNRHHPSSSQSLDASIND